MKPTPKCFKNHSLLNGCLFPFFKVIFLYTSCQPIKPLNPSYWDAHKYPWIHFQWNHFGNFSYDQRYPRKVQLLFLEHFYFCLLVLLIVIVSGVSWQSRRSTWRRTRRFQDSDEPGKQPFDHEEPFYIIIAFSLLHWVHDIPWVATLLGFPHCIPVDTCIVHDSILV